MGLGLPGTLGRGVGGDRCRFSDQLLAQRFLSSVLRNRVHLHLVNGAPPTDGRRRGAGTVDPLSRRAFSILHGHREGRQLGVTGLEQGAVSREELGHRLPVLPVMRVVLGRGRGEDRGGVIGESPGHELQVGVVGDGRGLAVEGGGGGAGGDAVGLGGRDGGGAGVRRGGEELCDEGAGGLATGGAPSGGGQTGVAPAGVVGVGRPLGGQGINEAL